MAEHPASSRDVVFPADRQDLYERNGYSAAVRANGLLFVSGQVGSREDGSPEPEPEAQIRRAFDNLGTVLKAAGCTFDDVQDVQLFMVDPDAIFGTVMTVKDDHFGRPPFPTVTAVGVTWLYGYHFEIKAIAKLPGTSAHG